MVPSVRISLTTDYINTHVLSSRLADPLPVKLTKCSLKLSPQSTDRCNSYSGKDNGATTTSDSDLLVSLCPVAVTSDDLQHMFIVRGRALFLTSEVLGFLHQFPVFVY